MPKPSTRVFERFVAMRYLRGARGRDEGRHMAICMAVMERDYPGMSSENRAIVTKQIRAGYLFLSAVLFEPPADFWDLPADFIANQREAEEIARNAGASPKRQIRVTTAKGF